MLFLFFFLQYVYWSDVHERSIHKAQLDGTDHTVIMSSSTHSIGIVDGKIPSIIYFNFHSYIEAVVFA